MRRATARAHGNIGQPQDVLPRSHLQSPGLYTCVNRLIIKGQEPYGGRKFENCMGHRRRRLFGRRGTAEYVQEAYGKP